MAQPTKFTKTKVAVGYLLLIIILLFSIKFILGEMELLSSPDKYETELNEKRKATNEVLSHLYQAEIIGQSLSTGRLNDYPLYKKAMKRVQTSVDSLKNYITDSLQLLRMDSITQLLIQKEQNMAAVLQALQEANSDKIYRENLEKILTEQDSVIAQQRVQRKVIVKENSYVIRKKKGFFKRLAEVFVPDKRDSTVVKNTSKEFVTDTLTQAYNPADTVAIILKSIQTQISNRQEETQSVLRDKSNALRYNGLILSSKINRIISDFETEEMNRSIKRLEQEKNIRQHSTQTIAWVAIVAIFLATGFLILIWQDITRSNHYRNELEIAKRKAEDLLIAREKLMLTITHDIKAPLGSIMGYIDLLARLTTEERQKFYIVNMKNSSEHLLKLINDLLDFHRLDSNKMEVNPIPFNPYQLFNEIKTSFEPIANQKNLELQYQITEVLNTNFVGDPFRIRQIANNLLSNALKFTQQGNVALTVFYQNSLLIFTVTDTGCGMSEEEQKNIFQEFTRLKSAQGEEGFGLGLSITKKLVFLLEGTIQVKSIVGKGSSFTVHLPIFIINKTKFEEQNEKETIKEKKGIEIKKKINIDEIDPDVKESREIKSLSPLQARLNILMIDDDRIQLNLTKAMLNQQNIQAVCCEHPHELIEYLEKEHFDFLLTDVQMPALNGFKLLTLLRQSTISQARTIPVIAVTARNDMNEATFKEKGFAGCLHKPFSLEKLMNTLLSELPRRSVTSSLQTKTDTEISAKIDFTPLTAFSENDSQAAAEIIRTFIIETERNCRTMEEGLQIKNMEVIAKMAHKLLPLLTMIKATDCLASLEWLERQREKTTLQPEAVKKTEQVLKEIRKIIEKAKSSF